MLNFRTEFPILNPPFKVNYDFNMVFIGSCFAEYIGNFMNERKFHTLINPFGIIYNPVSICESLERIIEGRDYNETELHSFNNLWFSFDHHGKFSDSSKSNCIKKINKELQAAAEKIINAKILFITAGTAIVYKYKTTSRIVANCHKLPAKNFSRIFLTPEEIVHSFDTVFKKLFVLNSEINIVITLSPVRHWSEGAVDNQLSKSILHYSLHEVIKRIPRIYYFPAYELMMDDLRDYRFYSEDMLHPGKNAIDYIISKFKDCFMDKDTLRAYANVESLIKALRHKPFHPDSVEYNNFLKSGYKLVLETKKEFPQIDLSEFEDFFLNSF